LAFHWSMHITGYDISYLRVRIGIDVRFMQCCVTNTLGRGGWQLGLLTYEGLPPFLIMKTNLCFCDGQRHGWSQCVRTPPRAAARCLYTVRRGERPISLHNPAPARRRADCAFTTRRALTVVRKSLSGRRADSFSVFPPNSRRADLARPLRSSSHDPQSLRSAWSRRRGPCHQSLRNRRRDWAHTVH